ncbi:MAG: DUF3857 domain-containing protein, partial [Candidatus Omnitrophica bacterium]|nr:DUF3857 domain-containing protein [Candidatus Omnitrophota bacterium]
MCLKSFHKLIIVLLLVSFYSCSASNRCLYQQESLTDFSRNYQNLTASYQQALALNPDDAKLRLELAQFYYNFRDYQKAKDILIGFDNPVASHLLAKTYARLKEYDFAMALFEQIKLQPQDSEYLYLYGDVLENKNLFPKALKIYAKIQGRFKQKAQKRIKFIKTNSEGKIPPQVEELDKSSQEFIQKIEDEAALMLLVDEETRITEENTSISSIHVVEKVLKERGKSLAEVEVGYDSTYQRVELEFARTITKDGKVVYAGGENIRDVSRYLNFPLYSNSRAFIVSMPAVDVGAIIEYKLKIYSSKLVNEKDFSFIYRLREAYPIFKASFRLIVPKKTQPRFKFFNPGYAKEINLEPVMSQDADNNIYSWEFKEVKSIIPEYAMPPESMINPAFAVSSFSSWGQIYTWWKSLYKGKLDLGKDALAAVEGLIKGKADDYQKAKSIYEFVAQNIRYVAIEYGDSGYEPHSAQEVFTNRYGDCKDQAILLVAMLKKAGLSAYPVLIPTRQVYPAEESFPSLNFNHAICAVQIEGKLIFMDPTAETTSFGRIPSSDQDRKVLVFFDDTWEMLVTPQSSDNVIRYGMDIKISLEENADITRSVISEGFFAASYRWYVKYTHPEIIKENIQKKMMEISSLSQLKDYKIENIEGLDSNPRLIYNFFADKFFNPAGKLRIVPVLDQVYLDYKLISKEERNYPIDFEGLYTKSADINIVLPENVTIKYLPSQVISDNPWFKLTVSCRQAAGIINFKQEFVVKKPIVEQKDYQKFKKYLEEAIYLLREEIILEKTQMATDEKSQ